MEVGRTTTQQASLPTNAVQSQIAVRSTTIQQPALPDAMRIQRNVAALQNRRMQRETNYSNHCSVVGCCVGFLECCTALTEPPECAVNRCLCVASSCSPCIMAGLCLGLN